MKPAIKVIILFVYLLGIVYLLPATPPTPDLIPSTRSTEEGDTIQHPDQRGFYTNLVRKEALEQMQFKFAFSVLGQKVPSFRLNYRTEEAFEMVRDQLQSSYLEEIVYPLRDSLFVNGWEPLNAPVYANLQREDVPKLFFEKVPYYGKVTIKPVTSMLWARLLVWTLIFPSAYLVYFSFKKTLKNA